MTSPRILVIVPAYNEEGNIAATIQDIRRGGRSLDILVVDDGSKDKTASEAAAQGVAVLSLPFNLGIGGAVQTGFKYAERHGYTIAVQVDGDGQHDAAYLDALLSPILTGQADISVGSRFLEASSGFKSSFSRRLGIRFFTHLIDRLTGVYVTDPTSGFRAHGKAMIAAFARYYPHDFPEPEAIVVARRLGARIVEVPVAMRPRQGGMSSIRRLTSFYYMLKVSLAICLHMMHRNERTPKE